MGRDELDIGIPLEADRVLRIWADYKRAEGGVVTLGYTRRSAGLESGGASTTDSFDEMAAKADRYTGKISDLILEEMEETGYMQQVMAIWNQYRADVARFRGDPGKMLADGCRVFLIEAKRRGIAV